MLKSRDLRQNESIHHPIYHITPNSYDTLTKLSENWRDVRGWAKGVGLGIGIMNTCPATRLTLSKPYSPNWNAAAAPVAVTDIAAAEAPAAAEADAARGGRGEGRVVQPFLLPRASLRLSPWLVGGIASSSRRFTISRG